jgi:hypothetical protein
MYPVSGSLPGSHGERGGPEVAADAEPACGMRHDDHTLLKCLAPGLPDGIFFNQKS